MFTFRAGKKATKSSSKAVHVEMEMFTYVTPNNITDSYQFAPMDLTKTHLFHEVNVFALLMIMLINLS
jgi:hypothetical protein